MNLEKLSEGLIVKNYKEMCALLGEPMQNGNSKKSQLKDWDRYFKYNKSGNKFIITEILDEPLDKVNNYKGGKAIYGDLVQLLIVDKLMQDKSKHISISKSQLKQSIGIQNSNYNIGKSHINKLSAYLNIETDFIYDFYNINDGSFNGVIETALRNLSKKRIIIYNTVHKCKPLNNDKIRDMYKHEMSEVATIEVDVAKELGYNSIEDVRKSSKYLKHQQMCKNIFKEKLNIEYYYVAYDIAINVKYIGQEKLDLINSIKDYNEREAKKKELNDLVMNKIVENAEKRHEGVSIKSSNKKRKLREDASYVENTKILSNTLIKRNTPNLTSEILATTESLYHQLENISEQLPF